MKYFLRKENMTIMFVEFIKTKSRFTVLTRKKHPYIVLKMKNSFVFVTRVILFGNLFIAIKRAANNGKNIRLVLTSILTQKCPLGVISIYIEFNLTFRNSITRITCHYSWQGARACTRVISFATCIGFYLQYCNLYRL